MDPVKATQQEYCDLLSKNMRLAYDSVGRVFCPVLDKIVIFNARGFHHLHYKPDGTARKIPEKIHKLSLVPVAAQTIWGAIEIEEIRDVRIPISRKKGAKWVKAKQYSLVSPEAFGGKRPFYVRAIILDIENAPYPIFWSIMKH